MSASRTARLGHPLSRRELDVIALVADGRSNAEIARLLYLSEDTVKTHLAKASRKAGATTRAGLVAWCLRSGYLRWVGDILWMMPTGVDAAPEPMGTFHLHGVPMDRGQAQQVALQLLDPKRAERVLAELRRRVAA